MPRFTDKLTETQIATIKALQLRGRPAPIADGFMFLSATMQSRLTDVFTLVERGLLYRINDQFDLTEDGKKLAKVIR